MKTYSYTRHNINKEERQFKYALLRSQGFNRLETMRFRDCSLHFIRRQINLRAIK